MLQSKYYLVLLLHKLGFSRRWNTMLNNARVQNAKGETVPAPMFSYMYNLTTIPQSNDQYSWMGLTVEKKQTDPYATSYGSVGVYESSSFWCCRSKTRTRRGYLQLTMQEMKKYRFSGTKVSNVIRRRVCPPFRGVETRL